MTTPGRAAPAKTTLALLAVCLALAYGIWYAYSVILVALLNEFGWRRSVLAGAFSAFAIVHGCANPIIGRLCDRLPPPLLMITGGVLLGVALTLNSLIQNPWQLYASFGALTAVAVACCGWAPAVVQVQRRFQHRLGLALGIVSSGIGVGMLLVVPLCQVLIDWFGWRAAFRVLALLSVALIVPSGVYLLRQWRPRGDAEQPRRKAGFGEDPEVPGDTAVTLAEAMRTVPFWLMALIFYFGAVASQTLHVHQVAFLVEHGIGAFAAAWVVGVVGVASVFGKTGGGWLSDRVEREAVFIAGVAILVGSVFMLMLAGSEASTPLAWVYAVMLGVGYSATAAITPAMVSDRFHGAHFGSILGAGLFGSAVGSASGPWLAGLLFDLTGSYRLPFLIAAGCGVATAVAALLAWRLRRQAAPRAVTG